MGESRLRVAVMGGGSWATGIAKIVMDNEPEMIWYMRRQEQIDEFMRTSRNPSYLSSVKFDIDRIHFTSKINQAVKNADVLIFATPSPFLKQHLKKLRLRQAKFPKQAWAKICTGWTCLREKEIHRLP